MISDDQFKKKVFQAQAPAPESAESQAPEDDASSVTSEASQMSGVSGTSGHRSVAATGTSASGRGAKRGASPPDSAAPAKK